MSLFQPTKTLLYPQFETYKLHPLNPEDNLLEYKLPEPGTTQSRASNNSNYLSFKEVRNRISWDHLSVNGNRGVYVDKDWGVVGFQVGDNLKPTLSKLASLPIPISTTEQQSEVPSVLPLTSDKWVISSGSGSLYVLETTSSEDNSFQGKFIAKYDLPSSPSSSFPSSSSSSSSSSSAKGSNELSPFLIRSSHTISETEVKLLLTKSIISNSNSKDKRNLSIAQLTKFELIEITLNPNHTNDPDNSQENLRINWSLISGDLPIYCNWLDENGGWLILSPEEYNLPLKEEKEESEKDKKIREKNEKISRLGLGATLPSSSSTSNIQITNEEDDDDEKIDIEEENKIYPYSWTQDSDSINMIIPIPNQTKRQDIKLNLTSTEFTLSLASSSTDLSPELAKFLIKSKRTLWTNIDPEISTWSFDSNKSQIEIDLSKVDQHVRWPSIFSPSEEDDDEEEEEEVPETLSQDILSSVRESFNSIKTRDIVEGEGEPITNHPTLPALLREEMDYDLEDDEDYGENVLGGGESSGSGGKVGKEVYIGFIESSTGKAKWSKNTTSILSLPVSKEEEGIIIKSGVDGLSFKPPSAHDDIVKKPWEHLSTNPALSFVLSSKKDLRLIKHLTKPNSSEGQSQSTVLAFDSGNSIGSGNVYIYYPPTKNDKLYSKQGVIPVSGGDKGALLGVGKLKIRNDDVVVVLTENSLVILKNVL